MDIYVCKNCKYGINTIIGDPDYRYCNKLNMAVNNLFFCCLSEPKRTDFETEAIEIRILREKDDKKEIKS